MQYKFTIPMRLPSLNDYINACRSNAFQGALMKRRNEMFIGFHLLTLPKITKPVKVSFHWVETNKKRDMDNIAFAKKFILDALVAKGKLAGDGWKYVKGLEDTFEIGESAKIIVTLTEVENDDG